MPSSKRVRRRFDGAAIMSTDAHSVTRDQSLREIVDPKSERKKNEADHEESAVVNAAAHYFAHFLRDDAGHGVHRLKERAETLGEIGDRDPVSGAQQNHHGLANDATEPEQNRRDDSRQ